MSSNPYKVAIKDGHFVVVRDQRVKTSFTAAEAMAVADLLNRREKSNARERRRQRRRLQRKDPTESQME